jgi:hypothetical protein
LEDTVDDEDYSISQFSKAKEFLLKSRAYNDLVERLRAEVLLTERKGTIIDEIRDTILDRLENYPKKNGYNLSACTVMFEVLWNLPEFLKRQFPGISTPKVGDILVYTGLDVDGQGSTCEQYIRQTWGTAGIEVLRGIEEAVRREQLGQEYKCKSVSYPSHTWIWRANRLE